MTYTEEQKADIEKRVLTALDYLKEQELSVATRVTKVQIGSGVYADAVQPFLVDIKYKEKEEPVPSPEEFLPENGDSTEETSKAD